MSIFSGFIINAGLNICEWWKDLVDGAWIPVTPDAREAAAEMFDNTATCRNVGLLFGYSFLPLLLMAFLVILIYQSCLKNGKAIKRIRTLFVAAWVLSFCVYDVGMYTGQYVSLFSNAPMAVIHACESFLLGSDVSAIHEPFHNSWVFMAAFSVSHAFSAFVSMLFLLKYFGFNIIQKLRLLCESRRNRRKETFIFWGINNPSFELIGSINAHFGNDDRLYRIIVVKTEDDLEESRELKSGFGRIFEFLSMNDNDMERLRDMHCFTCGSRSGLNDVPRNVKDIISGELNLKSLRRLVTKARSRGPVRLFFMSEDENRNIHDVSVLLRDIGLHEYADCALEEKANGAPADRKVEFYCHARHDSVHRVMENKNRDRNIKVHVIDSSHINVELLKTEKTVLPVNFVDVESDGTVSSAFNAMVIGFSEVGQDATRFLYEYGAFVKTGGGPDKAIRSDFHLEVVDKGMADKAGAFIAGVPAIKPYMPFVSETENKDSLLELQDIDACSVEFYRRLEHRIRSLNYVVIATENDELNMTLGVRIFKMAIRYRKNLEKLCILVRVHEDEDGHYDRTAKYYNRLWAAQESTGSTDGTSNKSFLKDGDPRLPIHIFGKDRKVYTYANIIDNELLREAKKYKELYESSIKPGHEPNYGEGENEWDKEEHRLLQLGEIFHCTYAGVIRLRRVQYQDMSNSLHSLTKRLIARKALDKCGMRQFNWETIDRKPHTTSYHSLGGKKIEEGIKQILVTLAQTEHLRWNASHEILGYVIDRRGLKAKDESLQTHGCLTEWENLDEDTRSYDCNVVDVTLGIKNPAKNK